MQKLKLISAFILISFNNVLPAIATTDEKSYETLPIYELRIFTEIFAKIKNDYVEKIDDRTLIEHAIRGMLEGLDPHSSYLDEKSYIELKENTIGKFGGLGIEIGIENGSVKVISPIDDTPAQRAGVKSGDLIIKLNNKIIKGMTLEETIKIMRGEPGSDIVLTIVRKGEKEPLNITITREIITLKSVKGKIISENYAYIRISNFQPNTTKDLKQMIEKLKIENKHHLNGLILDLRNNPGGTLNAAVGVADLFLKNDLIVYTEGRFDDAKLNFKAKPFDILDKTPIVVLVNNGSASASEIVAGALQDNKRAIIMGNTTFGKGSVQTIIPIDDKSGLKLTTARYYTPLGRSIQASGIQPDIVVDDIYFKNNMKRTNNTIKEADLNGHLNNSQDEKNINNKTADKIENDYQLYEALNILKALSIYNKNKI